LETRNAKANYFKDRLSQNFHNPKQFWNQLSNLLNKTKKSLIKNIKFNNEIISDPLLISQAFNQHFSSICDSQWSDSYTAVPLNSISVNRSFSFKRITPVEVYYVICDLKTNSSAGPD